MAWAVVWDPATRAVRAAAPTASSRVAKAGVWLMAVVARARVKVTAMMAGVMAQAAVMVMVEVVNIMARVGVTATMKATMILAMDGANRTTTGADEAMAEVRAVEVMAVVKDKGAARDRVMVGVDKVRARVRATTVVAVMAMVKVTDAVVKAMNRVARDMAVEEAMARDKARV